MKSISASALLLLSSSVVFAAERPCEAVTNSILANFASYGCENLEKTTRCDDLLKCIKNYDVCLVSTSSEMLIQSNLPADVSVKTRSIYFGIKQFVDIQNRPICVMAAMVDPPGMDGHWFYRVHRVLGDGESHEGSFYEEDSTEMQTSSELNSKMAEKLKEDRKLYLNDAASGGHQ